MGSLQNLVPSPDTTDEWICRPGAVLVSGTNFLQPSCMVVVSGYACGLFIDPVRPGYETPFVYNINGNVNIPLGGTINNSTTPTAINTTGAWQPPHAELVGIYIVLTHPNYSHLGTGYFGMINISNINSPTYNSYQLAVGTGGTTLPSTPVWCSQFNTRAFFFCNPGTASSAVFFSDIGSPNTFFNGTTAPYNNVLTFGNTLPLTCGGQLAFDNQLGGQTQSLIVFQGTNNLYQITGDPAPVTTAANINQGALAINSLNVATGTLAPNSVARTPKGLMFASPDGVRLIDFQGHVSDPIGFGGTGITVPVITSAIPSRMAAACNATTYRISTINGSLPGSPQQEWCLDTVRDLWYGPHTLPINLIVVYGSTFLASLTPSGSTGIFQTDIVPSSTSVYTELGQPMQCVWQSGYFPDRDMLDQLSSTRAILYKGYGTSVTFNVVCLDSNGNSIPGGTVSNAYIAQQTNWGQFAWGYSYWLGATSGLSAAQLNWTQPLVFDRMSVQINFGAGQTIRIADLLVELNEENYTVQST